MQLMGFVLTAAYLAITYLSPAALFPQLLPYRIQLCIALSALVVSAPSFASSGVLRLPQTKLLAIFVLWASLTPLFALRWFGGVLPAFQDLLANVTVMVLVIVNCNSLKRIRIVIGLLIAIAGYFIVRGAIPYFAGDATNRFVMFDSRGDTLRIRALSILEDPNDFAQMLVSLVPLAWFFYKRQRPGRNFVFCILPTIFLVWGVFLTHSRGGLLALSAVLLFALRRRLGRMGSALATGGALALFTTLNFTGNRVISMSGGADRMEFWGRGFIALKSSPLYGIGYGQFTDLAHGMTAHNSYVLCVTELGLVGYFFWLAIIVVTMKSLKARMHAERPPAIDTASEAEPYRVSNSPLTSERSAGQLLEDDSPAGIAHAATLLQLSLIGYLAAGYFLSRAYVIELWMLIGLATSVAIRGTRERPEPGAVIVTNLFRSTAIYEIVSLSFVYLILRSRGFG